MKHTIHTPNINRPNWRASFINGASTAPAGQNAFPCAVGTCRCTDGNLANLQGTKWLQVSWRDLYPRQRLAKPCLRLPRRASPCTAHLGHHSDVQEELLQL
jgi:hypothetical protein